MHHKFHTAEFYPTPAKLLDIVCQGINWSQIHTVLEPSAGKGDMVDYIAEQYNIHASYSNRSELDIDCIELDEDLRCTLIGKSYKVVHDDFLTFHTYKHYDLILMNPPFSNGDEHLLHALELQKNGGSILCILNAETLRNPYSNKRKDLLNQLDEYQAEISYIKDAFLQAENETAVEVAVIKVTIPSPALSSQFWKEFRTTSYADTQAENVTDLALSDYIESAVSRYNMELNAGIQLIKEFQALEPYLQDSFSSNYTDSMLQLRLADKQSFNINDYVRQVRKKYWTALFQNRKFTGPMTSNQYETYSQHVRVLQDYDFSYYNIKTMQVEMRKHLVKGIEDCIMDLFETLSAKYAYYNETSNNIHYYNGWKSNKSWIINKKVVIPHFSAFQPYSFYGNNGYNPTHYDIVKRLSDIEKALSYLDGGLTAACNLETRLVNAEKSGQSKKIQLRFFNVTFFKKGTCHIEFTNLELLKKFNIFGSQQKGWLPPCYGKKTYRDMNEEERSVIDEFEGKDSYEETLQNADFYLCSTNSLLLPDAC